VGTEKDRCDAQICEKPIVKLQAAGGVELISVVTVFSIRGGILQVRTCRVLRGPFFDGSLNRSRRKWKWASNDGRDFLPKSIAHSFDGFSDE
jgi:hypothetical protein